MTARGQQSSQGCGGGMKQPLMHAYACGNDQQQKQHNQQQPQQQPQQQRASSRARLCVRRSRQKHASIIPQQQHRPTSKSGARAPNSMVALSVSTLHTTRRQGARVPAKSATLAAALPHLQRAAAAAAGNTRRAGAVAAAPPFAHAAHMAGNAAVSAAESVMG